MSFGSVVHKIIDGVHHLFTEAVHDVEKVKVYIDARPGLKADMDKLLGPIKDAVVTAFNAKLTELKAASPDQALGLLKADIPSLLATVKDSFVAEAKHAGNVDIMLDLATTAFLASVPEPVATTPQPVAAPDTASDAPTAPLGDGQA